MRVVLLAILVVISGCRPRLLSLLESPSFTARDVLDDVRQAHSGGRRVLSMQFMSEESFHPGVAETAYPDLAPSFVARSFYDFTHKTAWQRAEKAGHSVLWAWDGAALTTTRDGQPYTPRLGIDRSQHLRALLVLLRAADAVDESGAELVRIADRNGSPRIRARDIDEVISEAVLEVDPESSLVDAIEYRVRKVPIPVVMRIELSDYREVNGVMVPHQMIETVPTTGAGIEYHTMFLWDVQVDVASAFPHPLEPHGGAPTPPKSAVQ